MRGMTEAYVILLREAGYNVPFIDIFTHEENSVLYPKHATAKQVAKMLDLLHELQRGETFTARQWEESGWRIFAKQELVERIPVQALKFCEALFFRSWFFSFWQVFKRLFRWR